MHINDDIFTLQVSLKIDEREVDHALQDKILMTSILQGGLSPSRL